MEVKTWLELFVKDSEGGYSLIDSAFYAPPPEALKWQARDCELAADASTERDAVEQLNFHQRDFYYYS